MTRGWRSAGGVALGLTLAAACAPSDPLAPDAAGAPDAAVADWVVASPTVTLQPAEETYRCSYHRVPPLPPLARLAHYGYLGVHDVTVELFAAAEVPVDDGTCRRPASAAMLLNSKRQVGEVVFPDDAPLLLGQDLVLMIRVHYLSGHDDQLSDAGVVLSWFAAPAGASQTSGLLVGARTDFTVPEGPSEVVTTCTVPAGTMVHGVVPLGQPRSYRLTVTDQADELVSTFDWAHPVARRFEPPFYQPRAALTATCEYLNDGGVVAGGDRTFADERCGVSAHIVPGAGVTACVP